VVGAQDEAERDLIARGTAACVNERDFAAALHGCARRGDAAGIRLLAKACGGRLDPNLGMRAETFFETPLYAGRPALLAESAGHSARDGAMLPPEP